MEYFTLNLKKLDGAKLRHGGCVECVDGKYYICSDAGYKHGVVYAMDGDVCSRPANTLFTLLTENNRYIYLTGQEFELACIPVKEEQMEKEACNVAPKEPINEKEIEIGIKAIDDFLATLLGSEFDNGVTCEDERDLGIWFDCGVEAVKDRAEVIAKEMKESLLQHISDKEEEVER